MKKNKSNKGKTRLPGMKNMRCPYCGAPVHYRSADGIYKSNDRGVMLYVCANYPKCDAYVRVHPGTNIPVGSLADAKLRSLRRTAHQHFDKLYTSGLMSKNDAYCWLAHTIQAPHSSAHIGYLSEYYCTVVITESKKFLNTWNHKLRGAGRHSTAEEARSYAAQ